MRKKARWDGEKWIKIKRQDSLLHERYKDSVDYKGFPIGSRRKPTNHKQFCILCRKPFEKNEQQIFFESGIRIIHFPVKGSIHNKGYVGKITERVRTNYSNSAIEPRRVYAHPPCFVCYMNYIALNGKIKELRMDNFCCECNNRFRCLTEGNQSIYSRIKVGD